MIGPVRRVFQGARRRVTIEQNGYTYEHQRVCSMHMNDIWYYTTFSREWGAPCWVVVNVKYANKLTFPSPRLACHHMLKEGTLAMLHKHVGCEAEMLERLVEASSPRAALRTEPKSALPGFVSKTARYTLFVYLHEIIWVEIRIRSDRGAV